MASTDTRLRGGRMSIPRTRGATSGLLLIVLGAWGAIIPFIGPYFNWAFTPDNAWTWTSARGWLEVLPGAVAVLGGLLLVLSANRVTAMTGAWLGAVAGAWLVVGPAFAGPLGLGSPGAAVTTSDMQRVWIEMTYFYGLGTLMAFLGGLALGRLTVRGTRDIKHAQRLAAAHERPVETDDGGERREAESVPATERTEPVDESADEPQTTDVSAHDEGHHNGFLGNLFGRKRARDCRAALTHSAHRCAGPSGRHTGSAQPV